MFSNRFIGGIDCIVVDAQQQARTERDVRGPWRRPGRVPSKLRGRKGTRRSWKRAHTPGWTWLYREPTDVLMLPDRKCIVTPRQAAELKRLTEPARPDIAGLFFNPAG
jgi:hypothetical protein